jgi:hypothetical protein
MSNHIFNGARKDPTRNKSWRLFPRMKGVRNATHKEDYRWKRWNSSKKSSSYKKTKSS